MTEDEIFFLFGIPEELAFVKTWPFILLPGELGFPKCRWFGESFICVLMSSNSRAPEGPEFFLFYLCLSPGYGGTISSCHSHKGPTQGGDQNGQAWHCQAKHRGSGM